jgi:hypothetical protein
VSCNPVRDLEIEIARSLVYVEARANTAGQKILHDFGTLENELDAQHAAVNKGIDALERAAERLPGTSPTSLIVQSADPDKRRILKRIGENEELLYPALLPAAGERSARIRKQALDTLLEGKPFPY